MTAPAVIQGTFADLKSVKTRGVVQLVVEVPIEHAAKIVEAFGFPQPGHEIPVAVARLIEGKAEKQKTEPKAIEGPGRRWSELSRAQQAGIRCGERGFQRFLSERWRRRVEDVNAAADLVRQHCAVGSRSEIGVVAGSGEFWDALDGAYDLWLRHPELPPADLKRSTGEAA